VYIARALAREGMNLILAARSAEGLEAVADELRATGCKVLCVPTDLSNRASVLALVARAEGEGGGVDLLVNNAGIEHTMPFDRVPIEMLDEMLEVNLRAPMILSRLLLPNMIARGHGHIVNVSSGVGFGGVPYLEPYCATKAGVLGLTRAFRATAKEEGYPVGCSAVCPGFVDEAGIYDDMKREFGVKAPMALGTTRPKKVASAVIRAVKRNVPEIIVNPMPIRPLGVLAVIAPRLAIWLVIRLGVAKVFGPVARSRALAEANRSKSPGPTSPLPSSPRATTERPSAT
jgi:short-subunit dehydrogenase